MVHLYALMKNVSIGISLQVNVLIVTQIWLTLRLVYALQLVKLIKMQFLIDASVIDLRAFTTMKRSDSAWAVILWTQIAICAHTTSLLVKATVINVQHSS